MKLRIKPSDRVSVVGSTGSGKTTLLKGLIRLWAYLSREWSPYHIVIMDTKKDGDFDGFGKIFHKLKELPKVWRDYRVLIWEVAEEEMSEEFYNGFFHFLRATGESFVVIIDELASIAKGNDVPREYELLMKQGRGKCQAVWAGIQNPVYVPHDFLSNANHFIVFNLNMETDRNKMASIVGDAVRIPPVNEHGFYYFQVGKRGVAYVANEPPIEFPIPKDFNIRSVMYQSDDERRTDNMNWKYLLSLVVLAFIMALLIPAVKTGTKALATTGIPGTKTLNDWVSLT